jgi:hypothetical protein
MGALGALAKSREYLARLLDAVRGAKRPEERAARAVRLGENCAVTPPLM